MLPLTIDDDEPITPVGYAVPLESVGIRTLISRNRNQRQSTLRIFSSCSISHFDRFSTTTIWPMVFDTKRKKSLCDASLFLGRVKSLGTD